MSELFSARVKRLSVEELEEAFGDQIKIEYEESALGNSAIECVLDSSISMGGEALELVYVNPVIDCYEDGTVDSTRIRNSRLFGCGYCEKFVRHFGEKFWGACANFLTGRYDEDCNRFVVWETGISNSCDVLLWFREDASCLTLRFLNNLSKTAYFFDTVKDAQSDDSYCLVVLGLHQSVTRYGNLAKERVCTTPRDWARLDESAFSRQFSHFNIDNGVYVARGWMIDRWGNEMKPTFQDLMREEKGRVFASNDKWLVETWTNPRHGDICLSCTMDDDGNVSLKYGRPYYPGYGHADITAHQLRRMEYIRRQLIEKLTNNARAWSSGADYNDICWEDQDTAYSER